jgi:hypothetical protein
MHAMAHTHDRQVLTSDRYLKLSALAEGGYLGRYPTLCTAAGLSTSQCADDPPTPPKPIDPAVGLGQDIYGEHSWPGLDGVDVWPLLTQGGGGGGGAVDTYAAHPTLAVSAQVWLRGELKLLLGQVCPWAPPAPGPGAPPRHAAPGRRAIEMIALRIPGYPDTRRWQRSGTILP